jgi:pyrimidine-nucleoside phosphorylase
VITQKLSIHCGRLKISKKNYTELDLSRIWRHPLFQHHHKNIFRKEILHWRTEVTKGDNKNPLVTVLSHNILEDKVSLVLVPLLASAGLRILKPIWPGLLSGQALLNNLLSIPGISLPSNPEEIAVLLERTGGGYVLMPESAGLIEDAFIFPELDQMIRFKTFCLFALYAIAWDGLVIDIRIGNPQNQKNVLEAQEFTLDLGKQCDAAYIGLSVFISSLDEPLGCALGPVLELKEAIDVLKSEGPLDFTKLAIEQGADLLMFAGGFAHRTQAKTFLKNQLQNGAALDKFKDIIQALGGTEEVLENLYAFPLAKSELQIVSHKEGYIHRIDIDRLSKLKQKLSSEHKGAGLILQKKIGDPTDKNDPLARVYLPSSWDAQSIQVEVQDSFSISDVPPAFQPLIAEKIKGSFRF